MRPLASRRLVSSRSLPGTSSRHHCGFNRAAFWSEEEEQCTYSPLILPEAYAARHMWPWICLSAVDFLSAAICHSTLSTTSLMAFSSSVCTVWSTVWTGHDRCCLMSSSICNVKSKLRDQENTNIPLSQTRSYLFNTVGKKLLTE